MARLDISNIDMNEIHVKVGGTSSTQVSMNDTDVRGMAAPDATYAGNDGISTGNNSTIAIGEFRNGEHTSLDNFFSLTNWDTHTFRNVASNSSSQGQARAQMAFKNDTANSRIECSYYGGSDAVYNTVYTSYINYTGYTGNINVKYTTSGNVLSDTNQGNYYYHPYGWPGNSQNSTSASYTTARSKKDSGTNYVIPTSGYVAFKWFVSTPVWTSGGFQSTGQDSVVHLMTFTVSFVSDSVTYSSTSASRRIELMAGRGPLIV